MECDPHVYLIHDTCRPACSLLREAAALVHTVRSQSVGVDRIKVREMENDGREKNETAPAENHLPDLCRCSNGSMPCTDFGAERSRTLCSPIMCFACSPAWNSGNVTRKMVRDTSLMAWMQLYIKESQNAKFRHYSASHSWGKLGFCRVSCGIARPIYLIYRKMDMQHCSQPTRKCKMLQI